MPDLQGKIWDANHGTNTILAHIKHAKEEIDFYNKLMEENSQEEQSTVNGKQGKLQCLLTFSEIEVVIENLQAKVFEWENKLAQHNFEQTIEVEEEYLSLIGPYSQATKQYSTDN